MPKPAPPRPARPARKAAPPRPARAARSTPPGATHLRDLIPDPANLRKHTPRNVGTIEQAMKEVGAARSIVIDENNVVLAGNATVDAAAAAGIEKVLVVEADGNTVVAVRRTGLTDDQKKRLAIFDNRAGELSEWNVPDLAEALRNVERTFDLGWSDEEAARIFDMADEIAVLSIATSSPDQPDVVGGDEKGTDPAFVPFSVMLSISDREVLYAAIARAKAKKGDMDTAGALMLIVKEWK